MSDIVLGDDLGPRGRRRVLIATMLSVALVALGALWVVMRFKDKGQLDWKQWEDLFTMSTLRFLATGLRNTLTVSLVAMALALVLGALGAFGRLDSSRAVRGISIVVIELFRATPLVLLIYFAGVAVPRYAVDLSSYWYLVIALALYNGSVIAEVFRSGIQALGQGQREAGLAIGLTEKQTLRLVLFPQAVRTMVPAIINQQLGEFNRNPLQALLLTGVVYVLINFTLSSIARRIESRQSRRQHARAEVVWANAQLDAG
jgi:glutamate transport system permease protein